MNSYTSSRIEDQVDSTFTCDVSDSDELVESISDEHFAQRIVACGMQNDGMGADANETLDDGELDVNDNDDVQR